MTDSYRTLTAPGESLWKAKGSKHLGHALHIGNEAAAKEFIDALRKEHHKANHVCYAWRLGHDGTHTRANDDGEPANSAGMPILGQIEKYQVTYVLVAVVRYFGGTKLGVGGLIDAYRTAAAMALDAASIEIRQVMAYYTLYFPYERMSDIMLLLRMNGWDVTGQDFRESCSLQMAVLLSEKDKVLEAFSPFPDIRVELNHIH